MASLILYIDGSECCRKNRRSRIGWGMVALHDGQMVERAGNYGVARDMTGYHELVALFEAVRYAHMAGFAPADVAFYTDDETVGYAGARFHPENYLPCLADATMTRLQWVADKLFSQDDLELSMQYLMRSRFHKLKGHRFCVYNNRVDYLARTIAKNMPMMDYGEWLATGIVYYTAPNVSEVWYPPFAHTDVARAA